MIELIEQRLRQCGDDLLAEGRLHFGLGHRLREDTFLNHLLENAELRRRLLHFVDVLPALKDDREVAEHLDYYLGERVLPVPWPGLVQWGLHHARRGVPAHLVAATARTMTRRMARRFIVGESVEQAWPRLRALHRQGMYFSLDVLGEATTGQRQAELYQQQYLDLIGRLASSFTGDDSPGDAQLSLKVSSLYWPSGPTDIDGAVDAIKNRLRPIFEAARQKRVFITLDMEQFDTRGVITRVFRELLTEKSLTDWPGAGIAMQAYLRDASQQLQTLIGWARNRVTPITVRLVRGAYWDYERMLARRNNWPSPVWEHKAETDACYEGCLAMLLKAYPAVRTAVATHNPRSICLAAVLAEEAGVKPDQYEYQMLYGMSETFQRALVKRGYHLRVYAPFGPLLPGMAYLVRRLLENSSQESFLRQGMIRHASVEKMLERPVIPDAPPSVSSENTFTNEPPRRFAIPAQYARLAAALKGVQNSLPASVDLLINHRPLVRDPKVPSLNPSHPAMVVGTVSQARPADVVEAVNVAAGVGEGWRRLPVDRRADYLRRAAAWLRQRRDEVAAWAILEAGKPWSQADTDVAEAIDFLEYYAWQAERRLGQKRLPDSATAAFAAGEDNIYGYHPRGVAAVIAPWNFPLAIVTGMTAAALAAGNTVVIKPAPQTPVVASLLVQALTQAEIPPGVVNFLPGGDSIGRMLVEHPRVNVIAFTGSEAAGREIYASAAMTRSGQNHLKHVLAEMGGKNAIIVDSDADLDDAVPGVAVSAFGYAGQKCSACSRVIVVGGIYQNFLDKLMDAVACLKVGPADDPATFVGPVIDEEARRRITRSIEMGRTEGKLAYQADLPPGLDGFYVPPTVFTEVAPGSTLAQEEIFGPVLVVMAAKDFAEALHLANNARFALTGGVYSRNPAHLAIAREQFAVGNLYFNRPITGAVVGRQPFGGMKMSGSGCAAGGPDYLLQFVMPRTVTENTVRHGFVPDI